MHLSIIYIWYAPISIIEYLYKMVPHWHESNVTTTPSFISIELYHYHVYAMLTQGMGLLHDVQKFSDLRCSQTNYWISPWAHAPSRRIWHQKKALITLYKPIPPSCVCHSNPRISINACKLEYLPTGHPHQRAVAIFNGYLARCI